MEETKSYSPVKESVENGCQSSAGALNLSENVPNDATFVSVSQTVEIARNTLKCNIFGIAGGFLTLFYGAYQCGNAGWSPTPMFCIGFGIIVSAWMVRENYLRDRDIELSVRRAVALDEKGCILARLEDLPSWVFFPETERVEWVNKILHQLWPYVGHYVREMLKETMEPSLRESLPSYLQSFKFEKIILGDIPPRLGGVKVYQENVSRNEIIIDMDIRYFGDCNILVSVKRFKAGIKDLQISGVLRIVLKPLTKRIPLVGGANVFFLNRPRIDFNLTNVANVLDLPGLGDLLRNAVNEQVAAMMVLPNKFPIRLIADIPLKSLKFSPPAGVLRLHIIEGRELVKADVGVLGMGKSDPYIVISVGAQEFKTPVIKNTVFPKWDYYCEPIIDEYVGQNVDFEVMDEDQSTKDDFLGRASIDISGLTKKQDVNIWLQLEDTKSGSIHFRSTWLTLSDNPEDLSKQLSHIGALNPRCTMYSAILLVFLDSARHLPNVNRGAEEPSAQVLFTVTGSKDSSAIRPHSNDPIWEETFRFLLHNPEIQDLTIEVIDTKHNKPIGMTRIHICRLLREKDMQIEEPFALHGAGPNSKLYITLQLKILVPTRIPESTDKNNLANQKKKNSDVTDFSDGNKGMELPNLPDFSPSARPLSPATPTIQNMIQTTVAAAVDSLDVRNERQDNPSPLSPTKRPQARSPSPKLPSTPTKTPSPVKKKTSSPPSLSGDSIKSNRSVRSTTSAGKIELTLRYSIPRNKLVVVVHKAQGLPYKESEDKPDAYVKIYLQPDRNKETKQKTQVYRNSCNPVFDESLEFEVNMSEISSYSLEVTVNSKSGSMMFPRGTVLGKCIIVLSQIDVTKASTEWYDLETID